MTKFNAIGPRKLQKEPRSSISKKVTNREGKIIQRKKELEKLAQQRQTYDGSTWDESKAMDMAPG